MIRVGIGSDSSRVGTLAAAGLGLALFFAALSARVTNVELAFRDGRAVFPPFDDVYHARRIAWSAQHPGRVLEFDPERGAAGAWCPWPPLYDGLAGILLGPLSRMSGVPPGDLATWIPPAASALAAAFLTFVLAWRLSIAGALVGGATFAFAQPFFASSRLGCIDHHFLEPALLLGILAAMVAALRSRDPRDVPRRGIGLAVALVLALFVQTALLFGAALAFVCVLVLARDSFARRAGALGFALASAVVAAWRLARPDGYPDSEWFLGWPHVAALAGAAIALAVRDLMSNASPRWSLLALPSLSGGAVVSAFPSALTSFLDGARFFGGDPWLSSIVEFQPLFFNPYADLVTDLARLGGAPLLAALLAVRSWRGPGSPARAAVAVFGVTYAVASIASARFLVPAAAPLAVAAAVAVHDLRVGARRLAAFAAAALALGPTAPLTWLEIRRPPRTIPSFTEAPIRAAREMAALPGEGRILSSWSLGHLFHHWSGRPVLVDGFGFAPGRVPFENASAILLSISEADVARYCDDNGVRFVALEDPLGNLPVYAATVGADTGRYLRAGPSPDAPPAITRLMQATFWWRAWADHGAPLPRDTGRGAGFSRFRLIYRDPELAGTGPFRRNAVVVWERIR